MGELRPWQIAVMVLAVVVLSGSILWQCNDQSKVIDLANHVTVADVVTGDLFDAPLPSGKAVVYPAKNPETGQVSVFPVASEAGQWQVPSRFRPQVREFVGKRSDTAIEDLDLCIVKTKGDKPKRANVF